MSYRLELSCPRCGGELSHLADGRPSDSGTRLSVIARCGVSGCGPVAVTVTLTPVSGLGREVA
jgi:hypothetical protein